MAISSMKPRCIAVFVALAAAAPDDADPGYMFEKPEPCPCPAIGPCPCARKDRAQSFRPEGNERLQTRSMGVKTAARG